MKNVIIDITNLLNRLNSRLDPAEVTVSKIEDRSEESCKMQCKVKEIWKRVIDWNSGPIHI